MARAVVAALLILVAAPTAHGLQEAGDRTITKVIKILQGMLEKSKEDAEKDTELFAKYKCYCDVNTDAKTKAIDKATKDIALLQSKIKDLTATGLKLSSQNAEVQSMYQENERGRVAAESLRTTAATDFKDEEADMKNAIGQMGDAISTLEAMVAEEPKAAASFLERGAHGMAQLNGRAAKSLKAAALLLPPKERAALNSFIQVPMAGTYKAQGGEIVNILKNMLDTFKENMKSAQSAEAAAVESYEAWKTSETDAYDKMKALYEDNEKMLSSTNEALASAKTTTEETLTSKDEDEEFVAKLTALCAEKTKAYETRNMIRTNENTAVSQAISILNSDAAFDTFGDTKAATEGSTGFLQLRFRTQRKSLVERVQQQLVHSARQSKSLRLAKVASMLEKGNPLDKVCKEVETMLALIDKEGAQDQEQLTWCNSERETNNNQEKDKSDMIDGLTEQVTELTDTIENEETGLKKLLMDEEERLKENLKDQADTTEDRNAENAAFRKNVKNLDEAEKTLKKATDVLKKFFDWLHAKTGPHHYNKNSGKDSGGSNIKRLAGVPTEDLEEACSSDPNCVGFTSNGWLKSSLEPEEKWHGSNTDLYVKEYETESPVLFQKKGGSKREDPAPPEAEFAEAGTEAGSDAVQMLTHILEQTEAEEKEARDDEAASLQEYQDTMADLKADEKTMSETIADLQAQLSEKMKTLEQTQVDLTKTTKEHKAIEKYLLKIKPGCDYITINIETRNEHRAAEIEALQSAEAALKDTPQYKKAAEEAAKESAK